MAHISSSVYKYHNSPTASILRIASKPDTATQEYHKKVHSLLKNTCNVDSRTHWVASRGLKWENKMYKLKRSIARVKVTCKPLLMF